MPAARKKSEQVTEEVHDDAKDAKVVEIDEKLIIDTVTANICTKLDEKFEPVNILLDALRKQNEDLLKENSFLKEELQKLQFRNDALEQHSRRESIRIFGIPEEAPYKEKPEQTLSKITDWARKELEMEVKPETISMCHRVGQDCHIIAKFMRRFDKIALFKKRAELRRNNKLKDTKITFKEDLTKRRTALLKEAKEVVGKKYAWSREGEIYVRIGPKDADFKKIVDYPDLDEFRNPETVD